MRVDLTFKELFCSDTLIGPSFLGLQFYYQNLTVVPLQACQCQMACVRPTLTSTAATLVHWVKVWGLQGTALLHLIGPQKIALQRLGNCGYRQCNGAKLPRWGKAVAEGSKLECLGMSCSFSCYLAPITELSSSFTLCPIVII